MKCLSSAQADGLCVVSCFKELDDVIMTDMWCNRLFWTHAVHTGAEHVSYSSDTAPREMAPISAESLTAYHLASAEHHSFSVHRLHLVLPLSVLMSVHMCVLQNMWFRCTFVIAIMCWSIS